jgi:hypothetical protein
MPNPSFSPFDPLEVRSQADTSLAAQRATRREIQNILSSYVGWYDPFCELIQNALDAVDRRAIDEGHAGIDYEPTVRVLIDLDENQLTVTDNGVGMSEEEFRKFLAPSFSFKDETKERGHKGVGATYLAYGFNYLRVHTKQPGHGAAGRIAGARKWTESDLGTAPPLVEPDATADVDEEFANWARGTSVTVRFDQDSQPSQLSWLKATTAETWLTILRTRTGLGSVEMDENKKIEIECVAESVKSVATTDRTSYFWLGKAGQKAVSLKELTNARDAAYKKSGDPRKVSGKYKSLMFIHEEWASSELAALMYDDEAKTHAEIIARHKPTVQFEYGYTTRLWKAFNDKLGVRTNMNVVRPGIQLAANRMPQGDVIQVPLTRYIGRQNQVHFLIHFENYTPDLGRKGFAKPLVDFASDLARAIVQQQVPGLRDNMKRDSGAAPDLGRQLALDEWKKEMSEHEANNPLVIDSEHFFHPTKKVSITSQPTREQDVIALFHELLSGGVIRGIRILATNERLTYDSLCRISFEGDRGIYEYDEVKNPLGIDGSVLDEVLGKVTEAMVLEYKFSLDGLMTDLDAQEKNIGDLDVCVAWEMGDAWQEQFSIQTLIVPENVPTRSFHGATHLLQDPNSGATQASLIILKDLVELLVDPETAYATQREMYE